MNSPEPHGGLRLPAGMDDVGATAEANIHKRWEFFDESKEYMENELGIPPPREPNFACPTLTAEDLTEPDAKRYTERYNEFLAWYNYLSEILARHESVALEHKAEMDDLSATLRESYRKNSKKVTRSGEAKPPPIAEMEDRIQVHPRYVELKQKNLKTSEIIGMLGRKVETLKSSLALLSRQVEIRRQNFEGNNRGSNIQGRGGLPGPGVRTPFAHRGGYGA